MSYKKQGTAWSASDKFFRTFASKQETPWFISYPRTGSHWLRLMLELYLERPLLRRTFFYPEKDSVLLIHEHDRTAEKKLTPKNVLFLYRNPVDTVFSLANYWKCFYVHDSESDTARYTRDYMIHLRKWLVDEKFTEHKTILRYEDLRDNPEKTFTKVLKHFGEEFDKEKFDKVKAEVTKKKVRDHTQDLDNSIFKNRVIAVEENYEELRKKFWDEKSSVVWETMKEDLELCKWFEEIIDV